MYNKYHNKKIDTPDGKFDSKFEYEEWCRLKLLEKAGEISKLQRQVPINLTPKFKLNGVPIRESSYIADFAYQIKDTLVLVDTKGYETSEYKLKKKFLLYKYIYPNYGIIFIERKKGKKDKVYSK